MAKAKIKLDRDGMAQMLNGGPVTRETRARARSAHGAAAGETASGKPVDVTLEQYVARGGGLSARTGFAVTMDHPAGIAIEAKRSTLYRAGKAAGLTVTRK